MKKLKNKNITEAEMRDIEEQGKCPFCDAPLKHVPEGRGTSLGPSQMGEETFFVSYYMPHLNGHCLARRGAIIRKRYK